MPTVREVEQRFLASRSTAEKIETITTLAGYNDDAAVQAIARLFTRESHPDVKVALISSLADIDPECAPTDRFNLLSSALTRQPRNVRAAALDVLAGLDNPRVDAILRRMKVGDPDREMRDIARALIKAREEDKADDE